MPLYFLVRSLQVLLVTPAFLVVFVPLALFRHEQAPATLRAYLQRLGGVFIKLGQFLAMRYDLLPLAYCQELAKLLDRLPPTPLARLSSTIERDIGRSLETVFASIDDVPIGSASLAQVHRAELIDGTQVVVKVMRPDTERRFRTDLLYLRLYRSILASMPFVNRGVADIMSEVLVLTTEELDFRREAENMIEMRRLMLEDEIDHYVPRIHPELCGRSTIVMEFIDGVPITRMLTAIDADDRTSLDAWARDRITPRRAARLILRSVLEQTMHHRLFQGDPHASNLIMMPGGTLAWVDFGVLGFLNERIWRQQLALRVAIAEQRLEAAVEVLMGMFAPMSRSQVAVFETEITRHLREWVRAARSPMATISQKSSGLLLLNVMRASQRAGLRIPAGLTSLYRTIMVADIVVLRLDPDLDWLPSVQAFVREEQARQADELIRSATSMAYAGRLLQLYLGAPSTAQAAMDWIDTTLPRVERAFSGDLSRLEASLLVVMRYGRIGFLLLALLAFLVLVQGALVPELWLMLLGLGILSGWVLTRVIRLYR